MFSYLAISKILIIHVFGNVRFLHIGCLLYIFGFSYLTWGKLSSLCNKISLLSCLCLQTIIFVLFSSKQNRKKSYFDPETFFFLSGYNNESTFLSFGLLLVFMSGKDLCKISIAYLIAFEMFQTR